MESTVLDPRPLLERMWSMDLGLSTVEEQRWGDAAADQVRSWLDAWQAALHIEMTLPRPLPPPPPEAPSEPTDEAQPAPAPSPQPLPELGAGGRQPLSRHERERRERRALLLSMLPFFAAALRSGRIHTGHVDALATALADVSSEVRDRLIDHEDDLLAAAMELSPDGFARTVRRFIDSASVDEGQQRLARQRRESSFKHWVNKASGMHCGYFQLDPERGAAMFGDIDAEIEALFHGGHANGLDHNQVAAQALVNLIAGSTGGTQRVSDPSRGGGLVLIDIETLTAGRHGHTICETSTGVPLPPDAVRRLMCLAEITYAFTFHGRVVGLACEDRIANREQRLALRAMYRSCGFPGCDLPFERCHIHHVIYWEHQGKTIIENLLPVCSQHHHLLHDGHWQLDIDTDRTLTWTRPDGTTHAICPLVPLTELDLLPAIEPQPSVAPAPREQINSPPATGPPTPTANNPPPAPTDATGIGTGTLQTRPDRSGELRLFDDRPPAA